MCGFGVRFLPSSRSAASMTSKKGLNLNPISAPASRPCIEGEEAKNTLTRGCSEELGDAAMFSASSAMPVAIAGGEGAYFVKLITPEQLAQIRWHVSSGGHVSGRFRSA